MYGSRTYRGGAGANSRTHLAAGADEETLDAMNTSMADGLSSKVSQLKNLAFDLDSEARDQLPLLDDVDDDMESGRVRLGGSSGRLRSMGVTRGLSQRRLTCYIGLGVCFFLVLVYFVLPHFLQ